MYDNMVPPATMSDYRAWAELRVEALRRALAGIPPERSRYHVCWGSWNGPHSTDVPLREIVDLVLAVPVGGYALEQANPRHEHEWERRGATSSCPPTGCCSQASSATRRTSSSTPSSWRSGSCASPSSSGASGSSPAPTPAGFAQTPYITRVHPTLIWAKLEALVEGARLASERLWA